MATSFPNSLTAFGTDSFQTIFRDELYDQANSIPLEDCMDNGGWPDTDSLDVIVSDVADDGNFIQVTVELTFSEQTPHSGCADMEGPSYNYRGTFNVSIDKTTGRGNIEMETYNPESDEDEDDDEPDIYVNEDTDGDEDTEKEPKF